MRQDAVGGSNILASAIHLGNIVDAGLSPNDVLSLGTCGRKIASGDVGDTVDAVIESNRWVRRVTSCIAAMTMEFSVFGWGKCGLCYFGDSSWRQGGRLASERPVSNAAVFFSNSYSAARNWSIIQN